MGFSVFVIQLLPVGSLTELLITSGHLFRLQYVFHNCPDISEARQIVLPVHRNVLECKGEQHYGALKWPDNF
jgi:hypothetical protein